MPAILTLRVIVWCACSALGAEDGLVAYYDFDEGSSATLRDLSGNGNDGKISGARYVKRGEGFCLSFDGDDDYVNCGNRPSIGLHDAVTLEAWVHLAESVAGEPGILGTERIVTCVSGDCVWNHAGRPKVYLFDLHGRAVNHDFPVTQAENRWQVRICPQPTEPGCPQPGLTRLRTGGLGPGRDNGKLRCSTAIRSTRSI